ncbi:PEPxxWA-CTERM sorting domain-containing protein [uncultured Sphingomonas sp.]|uniref:PEPxxWA-CTERM sorting domain-containing protein n=1 Tax=uncultured Sphingomonas sp. TaxID=158754 RepID=UPI0025F4B97F|nr:PEPxxWA-CTERM sorting domain-containing protein [uncultured Sphingomonas sp.]
MLLRKTALRGTVFCALISAMAGAVAAPASAALLPQSWNGWKWARSGSLAIQLGNNVSSQWTPYVTTAAAGWSTTPNLDYVMSAGKTTGSACGGSLGTVQICNSNYGATGWMGYTTVWTLGSYIVKATVKLNDYYFSQAKYNNAAFRAQVVCQELGNALGLQDSDRNHKNANIGGCMDYTNDPSGKLGTNGTLQDMKPSGTDLANLKQIYATAGGTQLAQTKVKTAGNAYAVPGAVPEPSSWLTMIAGFGLVGAAMRRRKDDATSRLFA